MDLRVKDSSATYLASIAVGDMHLLGTLPMSSNDLCDDDAISGKDNDERDEIGEQRIDQVPNPHKEMPEMVVHVAASGFTVRFDDIEHEEVMRVGCEKQDADDDPGDDDDSLVDYDDVMMTIHVMMMMILTIQ